MKIKEHIIAKIALIIVLSLTFSVSGVMLKNISEANVEKQHIESLNMPTANLFDKIDKWFAMMSDDLYYKVKPMSDAEICILSTVFCIILILLVDLLVGVGRSRTEERMEKQKLEI
jgi:hypothetical protein